MRTYIPLQGAELLEILPPARTGVAAVVTEGLGKEGLEQLFEDSLESAAFLSLESALASDAFPARVVAVAELAKGDTVAQWDQIESFHVDGVDAATVIEKMQNAETQAQLDASSDELWGISLEWFDGSELPALRRRFLAN